MKRLKEGRKKRGGRYEEVEGGKGRREEDGMERLKEGR